jgi:hypothetical protein
MSTSLEVWFPEVMLPSDTRCRVRAGGNWGRAGEKLAVQPGRVCVSLHAEGARLRTRFHLICQFEIEVAPGSTTIVELPSRRVIESLRRLNIESVVEALLARG